MAANQNVTQLTQQTGSADTTSLFYAVTGSTVDTGLPFSVLVNNLTLTGIPKVPTAAPGTNSTQVASTAYVITSFAPLASPTFTGTVTIPTPSVGSNTTVAASTAFVNTIFAVPPALGNTTPNTVAATTLSASSTVSGAGFTNLFASPPPLGSSAANTAAVTTLTSTTSGSTGSVIVTDTGASGANLRLTGNGGTTPSKTIRVNSGQFQIVNNAYSAPILGLTDGGNLSVIGSIAPATTAGIVGTTLADNVAAGGVGETISATNNTGAAMTSNTALNVTSISLTAGDWDVFGNVVYSAAAAMTTIGSGISTTSATLPALTTGNASQLQLNFAAGTTQTLICQSQRINISTTTTVYLVGLSVFPSSTVNAFGTIYARRRR